MKKALTLPENEFPAWVKVGAMSTPSSFSTRRISRKGLLRLRHDVQGRLTRSPHRRIRPRRAGGTYPARKSAASPSGCPACASAIISAEASVASMCAAAFTMCFAISPVPVASSSTVLAFTTGRISAYISSYAARSFAHESGRSDGHFCPRNSCVPAWLSFLSMLD